MQLKIIFSILFLLVLTLFPSSVFGTSLTITPEKPLQGEAIKIELTGATTSLQIKSAFVGKEALRFFDDKKVTAFYGIDLRQAPGLYTVVISLMSGESATSTFEVLEKRMEKVAFTIPEQLGGNTKVAQKKMVTSLANEQILIEKLMRKSGGKLWKGDFQFPVMKPLVTDLYGYQRLTGAYTVAHKGVDFRAPHGTEVQAINDGVVKIARSYRTYGTMVAVDHGLGIYSLYLHLSKLKVKEGQKVSRGQVIGLAGSTGYAEGAHLHLTIRINQKSIDPLSFFKFYKLSAPLAE